MKSHFYRKYENKSSGDHFVNLYAFENYLEICKDMKISIPKIFNASNIKITTQSVNNKIRNSK